MTRRPRSRRRKGIRGNTITMFATPQARTPVRVARNVPDTYERYDVQRAERALLERDEIDGDVAASSDEIDTAESVEALLAILDAVVVDVDLNEDIGEDEDGAR